MANKEEGLQRTDNSVDSSINLQLNPTGSNQSLDQVLNEDLRLSEQHNMQKKTSLFHSRSKTGDLQENEGLREKGRASFNIFQKSTTAEKVAPLKAKHFIGEEK